MRSGDFITPDYTTGEEISTLRKKLGITQKQFAALVNVSKVTVERWETSEDPVKGPVVLVVKMLERYPEYVGMVSVPKRTMPLRLWYMHKQNVCTIIDVNELQQNVKIYNFTDHLMFRAFGVNEAPDYAMYQAFLESRCFPRSRDKMKLVLRDLDLPFYDPFMIIQKTEGRMAEDDFWIRIEQ